MMELFDPVAEWLAKRLESEGEHNPWRSWAAMMALIVLVGAVLLSVILAAVFAG